MNLDSFSGQLMTFGSVVFGHPVLSSYSKLNIDCYDWVLNKLFIKLNSPEINA